MSAGAITVPALQLGSALTSVCPQREVPSGPSLPGNVRASSAHGALHRSCGGGAAEGISLWAQARLATGEAMPLGRAGNGSQPWGCGLHLGCGAPSPSGWQLRAVPSALPFCCSYGLCGIHYIDAGYLGFKAYFVAPRKGTVWVRGIRAVWGSGACRRPCAWAVP